MKKLNSFQDLEFLKNEDLNAKKKFNKEISLKNQSLFQMNYFSEIKLEDIDSGLKSVFTDDQVINIIYKISNRNIRKLVWEFERIRFTSSDRYIQLKFILHTISMKLLKKYGALMLSFIIDLKIYSRTDEVKKIHSNIYSINLDKEILESDTISVKKNWRELLIGFEQSENNNNPYLIT